MSAVIASQVRFSKEVRAFLSEQSHVLTSSTMVSSRGELHHTCSTTSSSRRTPSRWVVQAFHGTLLTSCKRSSTRWAAVKKPNSLFGRITSSWAASRAIFTASISKKCATSGGCPSVFECTGCGQRPFAWHHGTRERFDVRRLVSGCCGLPRVPFELEVRAF